MRKTKVLVTGGAGFIGSHLVDRLIAGGNEIFVVDDLSRGNLANLNKKANFIKADITSSTFTRCFEQIRPQIIFHLAAQSSVSRSLKNPEEDIKINLLATVELLERAKEANVKKIIFASSAAIFGHANKLPVDEDHAKHPISTYGLAKLCAEYFFHYYYKRYHIPYICLRLANVYGPRQDSSGEGGVVAIFASNIIRRKPLIIYGDGNQTRDFIYVSDIIDACMKSLQGDIVGEFNVATSTETSINNLFKKISKINGIKPDIKYSSFTHPEVIRNALSYLKFNNLTSWEPRVFLEQGLVKTFNYFKNLR